MHCIHSHATLKMTTRARAHSRILKTQIVFLITWLFLGLGLALGQAPAFESAVAGLSDADPMARRKAAVQLGKLRDKRAVPHLLKALGDRNPYVRGNVAGSLGCLRSTQAAGELIKMVKSDPHPHARGTAAMALAYVKDPKAVPVLIGGLKDSNAGVRQACAEALGLLKAEDGTSSLMSALGSADAAMEKAVVIALSRIGVLSSLGSVTLALEKSEDIELQLEVIRAFGRNKHREAVPALKKKLRSKNGYVQIEASRSLARLGDNSGLNVCRGLLSHKNRNIRRRAAKALKMIRKVPK